MGRKGYDRTTKIKAKALWIVGNHSDQQIADQLGIARSKTIGGWRKDEGWDTFIFNKHCDSVCYMREVFFYTTVWHIQHW